MSISLVNIPLFVFISVSLPSFLLDLRAVLLKSPVTESVLLMTAGGAALFNQVINDV